MDSKSACLDTTAQYRSGELAWPAGSVRQSLSLVLWAFALSSLLLWASYPGFMSFDSVHTLREAREGVTGGAYPPMASYLWRVVEYIAPGPAPMLLVQNTVVLASVGVFLVLCGYGAIASGVVLAMLMLLPAIVGPMLVVWKDVAMTAAFAFATTMLLAEHLRQSRPRPTRLAAVFFALVIGMALRVNALPAAIPLILWAIAIASRELSGRRRLVALAFGGALATALALLMLTAINTVRLPDLNRLNPNTSVRAMQVFDLIGTAAKRDAPVIEGLPDHDPRALGQLAARIYDPRHLNLALGADQDGAFDDILNTVPQSTLTNAWVNAITQRPGDYLDYRIDVFAQLIGATGEPVFYPTHPGIDPNEFGYTHSSTFVSSCVVGYVLLQCGSDGVMGWSCRVWFFFVVALAASALAVRARARGAPDVRWPLFAILASSLGYLVPLFFISPASDLRYAHWAVMACVLVTLTAARMFSLRRRVGSG